MGPKGKEIAIDILTGLLGLVVCPVPQAILFMSITCFSVSVHKRKRKKNALAWTISWHSLFLKQ
jgi:hypothetical protein